MAFIELKNIVKEYELNKRVFRALNDVSVEIEKGEFILILGPSGCGKSTMLNILGGMDKPTSGDVIIADENISKYKDRELTAFRKKRIGFVFQQYNLIGNLTAIENIMMANEKCSKEEAIKSLERLGLKDKANSFPNTLSGGEMQRISIARAILKHPEILLCDEPTGALDSKNGKEVMDILKEMNEEGQTIVMVTHNQDYVSYATRVIYLRDGVLDRGDSVE